MPASSWRLGDAVPIFVGASLLFWVQPIVGRVILPWFGGSPAVWTTCMLCFQVLLLLGYGYAHLLGRLPLRRQALVHAGLLATSLLLELALLASWGSPLVPSLRFRPDPAELPVLGVARLILVICGLPYFILASTSPLLQRWFSLRDPSRVPYRLYALSNVGSLLALISYPIAVEPALTLPAQGRLWALGYLVFAIGCAGCVRQVLTAPPARPQTASGDGARPDTLVVCLWFGLPACAVTLLLTTTNHLCQDVAVIPFLWIAPLAVYLLSFVLCFDHPRWYRRAIFLVIFAAVLLLALRDVEASSLSIPNQIALYLVALFVCCMVCHGEVVLLKPQADHLTAFYLWIAVGGALGGGFVSLIAPLIFDGFWELPVGLVALAALVLIALARDRTSLVHRRAIGGLTLAIAYAASAAETRPATSLGGEDWMGPALLLVIVVPLLEWGAVRAIPKLRGTATLGLLGVALVLVGVALDRRIAQRPGAELTARTFFGVLSVRRTPGAEPGSGYRELRHGMTLHGLQYLAPAELRRSPTTYYGRSSGIGRVLGDADAGPRRVGVVGLGAGTIAAYARAQDVYRFYEIDPQVIRLAGVGGTHFSYLSDSPAKISVVPGDARLSLERALAAGPLDFDVLVIDAFSGDSIPMHLFTREAFEIYLRALRSEQSMLALHITNKSIDLRPVVAALAQSLHLAVAWIDSPEAMLCEASEWVILARSAAALETRQLRSNTARPIGPPRLWTDQHSSLFGLLK